MVEVEVEEGGKNMFLIDENQVGLDEVVVDVDEIEVDLEGSIFLLF